MKRNEQTEIKVSKCDLCDELEGKDCYFAKRYGGSMS